MKLEQNLGQVLSQLPQSVEAQAKNRLAELLAGVARYHAAAKPRDLAEMPVIWQHGSVRLLDYGVLCASPPSACVLLVPSLINRYYILDLSQRQSFARYLASQNIYPIVLDWGAPTKAEMGFNMADYVSKRLIPAMTFCAATAAAPLHLAGYCLGGVLALAAAQLAPQYLQSIALLATPWDFHAKDANVPLLPEAMLTAMEQQIMAKALFAASWMQSLFVLRQPFAFDQKFSRFAATENSCEMEEFILLEQWVNDGVDMVAPAARDCLIDWIQRNRLACNQWQVAGMNIDPRQISLPAFLAIPTQDSIVPYGCASALAAQLQHKTSCTPNTGHVGMIVGSRAKKQLWEPYTEFVLHGRKA